VRKKQLTFCAAAVSFAADWKVLCVTDMARFSLDGFSNENFALHLSRFDNFFGLPSFP
jgi:hypothetical protein